MDLKSFKKTPPWEWPRNAGKIFREAVMDRRAKESDRIEAAELASNLVVMNDEIAGALLAIMQSPDESEKLRAQAAISLGPILEQADMDQFEEPDEIPITEFTFHRIKDTLHKVYLDESVPKLARRRILEASVRASEDWHRDAIGAAYSSGDKEWILTAVFAMNYVRGFDQQILEALESTDLDTHIEAVDAAGAWQLDAAWPHVVALVEDADTPKGLLIAAIGACASIRPAEAGPILVDLADSDDEEVAEAASEAMEVADFDANLADGEEDENEWIN